MLSIRSKHSNPDPLCPLSVNDGELNVGINCIPFICVYAVEAFHSIGNESLPLFLHQHFIVDFHILNISA